VCLLSRRWNGRANTLQAEHGFNASVHLCLFNKLAACGCLQAFLDGRKK
jgi:hypothetical protein